MTDRTDDEILARIEEVKHEDWIGTERSELITRLPFDKAQEFLKEGAPKSDWVVLGRDRETVLAKLKEYMPFAWEKANNCRSISASRSLSHMRAFLWLMQDDALLDALNILEYSHYGKPQLREICERFGIDWRALDDDEWGSEELGRKTGADAVPRLHAVVEALGSDNAGVEE